TVIVRRRLESLGDVPRALDGPHPRIMCIRQPRTSSEEHECAEHCDCSQQSAMSMGMRAIAAAVITAAARHSGDASDVHRTILIRALAPRIDIPANGGWRVQIVCCAATVDCARILYTRGRTSISG